MIEDPCAYDPPLKPWRLVLSARHHDWVMPILLVERLPGGLH
jgi:hypothetical protein